MLQVLEFRYSVFCWINGKLTKLSSSSLKAHLHYGKNSAKLVGFKEQKKNILQF